MRMSCVFELQLSDVLGGSSRRNFVRSMDLLSLTSTAPCGRCAAPLNYSGVCKSVQSFSGASKLPLKAIVFAAFAYHAYQISFEIGLGSLLFPRFWFEVRIKKKLKIFVMFVGHASGKPHAIGIGMRHARKVLLEMSLLHARCAFLFTGYSLKDLPFDSFSEADGNACMRDFENEGMVGGWFAVQAAVVFFVAVRN